MESLHGILGVGHPLLDIIATVPEEFLSKYGLKPDDCVLANETYESMCMEIIQKFPIKYVPGGSVQNTMRVAQWFYPSKPETTMFMGCIGQDNFGQEMIFTMAKANVNSLYMVAPNLQTGTCTCLITNQGLYRSLITNLGASLGFHIDHLHRNNQIIRQAKIIYISGFFLGSNPDCAMMLARSSLEFDEKKFFTMNLSAVYITKKYPKQILQILPYVDLLFGNSTEYSELAKTLMWPETDLEKIVQKISQLEHQRKNQKRLVIMTQGERDIIVGSSDPSVPLLRYPVVHLPPEKIVDTNGSGDAFVGGFLAYHLADMPLKECLKAGVYAAQEVIKHNGCAFPDENFLKIEDILDK